MVLPVRIYIAAFRTFNIGIPSAMGTIMALTLIIFTVVFLARDRGAGAVR